MSLGIKISVIVLLKLVFIFWVKITYFNAPLDVSESANTPAEHVFNLQSVEAEKQ